MPEFTWKIDSLERRANDGFVTAAHWSVTAVDGIYEVEARGVCGWPDGQPTVPYADLVEQQVLAWCWNAVGKDDTEKMLDDQLASEKVSLSTSGTPWSNYGSST